MHWGWPNVYVFTKALGEMVLMQEKGEIPLVIVRPTIVTSTYKEPMPGWIEGVRYHNNIWFLKLRSFGFQVSIFIDEM